MVDRRALIVGATIIFAVIAALATVLARPAQQAGVTLVVVTRLAPDEAEALRSRFLRSDISKRYNIVDVIFLKEDVAKWPAYAMEGKADLFYIGGYALYKDLCEKGYLRPITDRAILDTANAYGALTYRLPDGSVCFVAVARTVFSFTVNTEFLGRYNLSVPRRWGDVLEPHYALPLLYGESLVSFPKPSKSTTAARTLQLILQRYGWDFGWVVLTILGANSYIVESSEKARDDVALGVAGLAPTVLVYGLRAEEASGGRAKLVPAEGEVLPDVSPAAVAKNSPRPREAQAFILWLLTPEGQRAQAELFYYLPYVKLEGIRLEQLYEELRSNVFAYDPEEASRWERAVVYYFEAAIADPDANSLLKSIWRRAVELYLRGKLTADELRGIAIRLGSPLVISLEGERRVFDKGYAIEVNKRLAEDAAFRSRFYDVVKAAALERYSRVLEELSGK